MFLFFCSCVRRLGGYLSARSHARARAPCFSAVSATARAALFTRARATFSSIDYALAYTPTDNDKKQLAPE